MGSKTKNEDNLIHVKLEYTEAVQSKKDILGTQRDLLEVMKSIKRYHLMRLQEMKMKELLYKKLKEFKLNLNKLNKSFPNIKLPSIIHHDDSQAKTRETVRKIKEIAGKDLQSSDLERELADIQKKLKELE